MQQKSVESGLVVDGMYTKLARLAHWIAIMEWTDPFEGQNRAARVLSNCRSIQFRSERALFCIGSGPHGLDRDTWVGEPAD